MAVRTEYGENGLLAVFNANRHIFKLLVETVDGQILLLPAAARPYPI
jgi:hypothetical protein